VGRSDRSLKSSPDEPLAQQAAILTWTDSFGVRSATPQERVQLPPRSPRPSGWTPSRVF
jgi:hypothetical protein